MQAVPEKMGQLTKCFFHHLHFLQSYLNRMLTLQLSTSFFHFRWQDIFPTTICFSLLLPHTSHCDYLIWMAIFFSRCHWTYELVNSRISDKIRCSNTLNQQLDAVRRDAIEVNKTSVSHLIFYSLFELGNRFTAHFILNSNANKGNSNLFHLTFLFLNSLNQNFCFVSALKYFASIQY